MNKFLQLFSTSILDGGPGPKQLIIIGITAIAMGVVISAITTKRNSRMQSYITLLPLVAALFMMMSSATSAFLIGFALLFMSSVAKTDDKEEMVGFLTGAASGVSLGLGYVGLSVAFIALSFITTALYKLALSKMPAVITKRLCIIVPEDLNYQSRFEGVLDRYTLSHYTEKVELKGFGEMYKITFIITMKDETHEKEMLDDIRVIAGNAGVSIERI